MRASIKIKFSIFLAALLLLTVFLLSLLVLGGIQTNQQLQYERYLAQQAKTVNIYFLQTILAESNKSSQAFLQSKGREFAAQLETLTGQLVVLYDEQGQVVSRPASAREPEGIRRTLTYALDNKIAYLAEGDSLYYMAPLRVGSDQVGVVQLYYSLTENLAFYNQIKGLFLYIGAGVFVLSFMLAYFYFETFANGIIRLNQMVDRIRDGQYETTILTRRDEIGKLSQGIHAMSRQIKDTIQGMEAEQEKLTLAVNKLSLLDQQQKQFIGNVTHEFKTPLTSIKAYLDLLEMYPDDEGLLGTAIANISSEAQRLFEMVDKVLQLSALEKYEFEFNKERVEVSQLIQSVLGSLKGKLDKFGLTLETALTEAYVEADRDSLTMVLINLLDNAIKYNQAEGRIFVRNFVEAGQVMIEIADTGIGIPPEVAHKIFEPFYTVDKNRSRQNGGAGLGLSLAQRQAEAQGGSLTLVSTGPEGTLFRVSLPAHN